MSTPVYAVGLARVVDLTRQGAARSDSGMQGSTPHTGLLPSRPWDVNGHAREATFGLPRNVPPNVPRHVPRQGFTRDGHEESATRGHRGKKGRPDPSRQGYEHLESGGRDAEHGNGSSALPPTAPFDDVDDGSEERGPRHSPVTVCGKSIKRSHLVFAVVRPPLPR